MTEFKCLSYFLSDSSGEVRQEIYNKKGNPQYKFFYFDDASVVESMKEAKDLLAPQSSRDDELWYVVNKFSFLYKINSYIL